MTHMIIHDFVKKNICQVQEYVKYKTIFYLIKKKLYVYKVIRHIIREIRRCQP